MTVAELSSYFKSEQVFLVPTFYAYSNQAEIMVNMLKNHSVFAKKPWKMPNLLGNKGFSTTFAEYIYKNSTN